MTEPSQMHKFPGNGAAQAQRAQLKHVLCSNQLCSESTAKDGAVFMQNMTVQLMTDRLQPDAVAIVPYGTGFNCRGCGWLFVVKHPETMKAGTIPDPTMGQEPEGPYGKLTP